MVSMAVAKRDDGPTAGREQVDKSMLLVAASAPVAGQRELQRLPQSSAENATCGGAPRLAIDQAAFPGTALPDRLERSSEALGVGGAFEQAVSCSALKSASDMITTSSPFCRVTITGAWSALTRSIVLAS